MSPTLLLPLAQDGLLDSAAVSIALTAIIIGEVFDTIVIGHLGATANDEVAENAHWGDLFGRTSKSSHT